MAWPNVYNLDTSRFDQDRPNRPTIVLVHDAFHGPCHFEQLVRELRDLEYRVLTPQLPSSSSNHQQDIFDADVRAICESSKPEVDRGTQILFVLHGYAGLPGSIAAERLNRYALGRPRIGFVMKIVFIAALIANESECVLDVMRPEWLVYEVRKTKSTPESHILTSYENGVLGVRRPDRVFYQDCSSSKARSAVSKLQPQIADSFRTRMTSAGWSNIPCLYVVCDLDQAIHPTWQQSYYRKLQGGNRQTEVMSLHTGHSPFLSRTRDTARMIAGAANGH